MSVRTPTPSKLPKHFTPFRSAAEEFAMKSSEDVWTNEGGQLGSSSGLVVSTPGGDLPYKAILSHQGRNDSEHPFTTMREAEAFIRRNTPVPPARRTLYDRDASPLKSDGG
jgi:hypothetical protein